MLWRNAALVVIAVIVIGFAVIYNAGPTPPAWYPPCPLHATTGLYCPGCGSARVFHDLAYGNIRAAIAHNALIVVLMPFMLWWIESALWRGLRYNTAPFRISSRAGWILVIVIVAFGVARNLPWWPFALLAP